MEYVEYQPIYEESVKNLLNTVFPGKNISSQSFGWKHFDNFFKGKSVAMVACDGEVVCSFVCFTPIDIIFNGEQVTFYSCAVQATHKDYRRRGIVSDLTLLIEKKLGEADYLGFSNSEGVQIDRHSKRINYHIVGRLKTYYLPSLPLFSRLRIKQVKNLEDLETFDQIRNDSLIHLKHDKSYLAWRYGHNPKNKFSYFQFSLNKENVGFVVVKRKSIKYEILQICVLDYSLYREALKAISFYALTTGVLISSLTLMPTTFTDSFKRLFISSKEIDMYLTVKSDKQDFKIKDNWLVQGGDIH